MTLRCTDGVLIPLSLHSRVAGLCETTCTLVRLQRPLRSVLVVPERSATCGQAKQGTLIALCKIKLTQIPAPAVRLLPPLQLARPELPPRSLAVLCCIRKQNQHT